MTLVDVEDGMRAFVSICRLLWDNSDGHGQLTHRLARAFQEDVGNDAGSMIQS